MFDHPEIYAMAQYASLFSVDISKMYLWSKFEDSTLCGCLENELNAKSERFVYAQKMRMLARTQTEVIA